jgi:hypothetical protein
MMIGRRRLLFSTLALAGAFGAGFATREAVDLLAVDPIEEAKRKVLPGDLRTGIFLRDSIARLADAGVIVPAKLAALYRRRGGMPSWVEDALAGKGDGEIVLSLATASDLLNLLWPLGLATKTSFTRAAMPVTDKKLSRLASTGGWNLGETTNGAAYFSKVETLKLTEAQEAAVAGMAKGIYRPCCNNSALFQDCNHGSAMLGFLELGISQDVPRDELLRLAKALNGYWYPDKYIAMALVFARRDGISWNNVPPVKALGADYSSLSGWRTNVARPLAKSGILQRRGNRAPRSSGCAL